MNTKNLLLATAIMSITIFGCKKEKDKGTPTVTYIGKSVDRVLSPKTYIDPGATATDDVDGDLTSQVVAHNSIDYSHPNVTYDIYYTATDAAGNEGSTGQRLVMLINLGMQFEGVKNGILTYWDPMQFVVADSLKFTKFAGYPDAHINAFMPNDSTLTIASQTVTCGDPLSQISRTFSGTGTINYVRSGPSIRTTITINYTQFDATTNTTTGTIVYKN